MGKRDQGWWCDKCEGFVQTHVDALSVQSIVRVEVCDMCGGRVHWLNVPPEEPPEPIVGEKKIVNLQQARSDLADKYPDYNIWVAASAKRHVTTTWKGGKPLVSLETEFFVWLSTDGGFRSYAATGNNLDKVLAEIHAKIPKLQPMGCHILLHVQDQEDAPVEVSEER